MNEYASYIALSRYARLIEEKGRRETWPETVKRYCDFWKGRYPDLFPYDEVYDAIVNLEVMPSMRALMTAGPALDRDEVAGYNPVSGDTIVVTKELGNIPIRFLKDKYYSVLNKDGRWAPAHFKAYGKQELLEVNLRLNSNSTRTVKCTKNHRWLLETGEVVRAEGLTSGSRIPFVSVPRPEIDEDYILGIRHGLVYGDGTAVKSCKRVKGFHIRLCGNSNELLSYFDNYPVAYPKSANGDPVVMLYDDFAATHDLKDLPWHEHSQSYLLGFIRGWMAADGSVSKSSQISLCTANEGKVWLEKWAETLGFVIQRVKKQSAETNYGKRKQDSFVVYFSRSSCVEDDFLCSWKRELFKPLKSHWVVTSVISLEEQEEVFCAEVPDTNTFTIGGGLITGNCAYLPIDHVRAFDETLYILMCGTGVGFSVERQYINQLPEVPEEIYNTDTVIHVKDSKIGWATALRELIALLYSGKHPRYDLSKLRPAGARLRIFGGRSSGPGPLDDLFQFVIQTFVKAKGRKLNSVEVHDVVCKIASSVVVGGVRRSALLSLSNLTDERMQRAKMGQWWEDNIQRRLANNSVAYTEKPDIGIFLREWGALYESKSGERGIFNRTAAKAAAKASGRRDPNFDFGTNPCGEIILRPNQFCNLSEVVARDSDTLEDLKRKVRVASIIGTFQSTLTNFRYLRPIWRRNAEEERLLGVSLTGIMDNRLLGGTEGVQKLELALREMKDEVIRTNATWADKLGINHSAATTCVDISLAQEKSGELRETLDQPILSQATILVEGATTIPQGSTCKCMEAPDTTFYRCDDIV